jgi:hypothetical protein
MIWVSAALVLVVSALTVFVLGLLRSHAELLRRLGELESQTLEAPQERPVPVDARPLPDGVVARPAEVERASVVAIRGIDADLQPFELRIPEAGTAYVLLSFLSTTCLTCLDIWRDIIETGAEASQVEGGRDSATVLIVLKGREEENLGKVRALTPDTPVPVVLSADAWTDLSVPGSPYFALIEADGHTVVGAGSAQSWEQLKSLASDAMLELSVVADMAAGTLPSNGYRSIIEREDEDLRRGGVFPGDPSLGESLGLDEDPDAALDVVRAVGVEGEGNS